MMLSREVELPDFEAVVFCRPSSEGIVRAKGIGRGNRGEAVAINTLGELEAYQPPATSEGHDLVRQGHSSC